MFWEKVYYTIWWLLIFFFFLALAVKLLILIFYNFRSETFDYTDRFYYMLSFIFAIVWLALLFIMWVKSLLVPLQSNEVLDSHSYSKKWGFIYTGLRRGILQKTFYGLQVFFYIAFPFFLVFAYNKRVTQTLVPLIFSVLLFLYIAIIQPANTSFWRIEQIIVHFLLVVLHFLVCLLVWDDNNVSWSGRTRWIMGWFIVILFCIILLWNIFILVWRFLDHWMRCNALAKVPQTGLTISNMRLDDDYEGINTQYKQNVQGKYELIDRPDLV